MLDGFYEIRGFYKRNCLICRSRDNLALILKMGDSVIGVKTVCNDAIRDLGFNDSNFGCLKNW